jgi:hypothetical protein
MVYETSQSDTVRPPGSFFVKGVRLWAFLYLIPAVVVLTVIERHHAAWAYRVLGGGGWFERFWVLCCAVWRSVCGWCGVQE